uniref:PX domain-containing protein n=1 Tax=Timema shepardi TaxID=629360 RepID=A0A7R9AZ75_TIMSH|nr:unnamed protein product [Timema shepardi]
MSSSRVVKGEGVFHTHKVNYSKETQQLIKGLLEESRLSILQRRRIQSCVQRGESLPLPEHHPTVPPRARSCSVVTRYPAPGPSGKRTKDQIARSGAYDKERFWPTKPAVDKEKEKQKLQSLMAFGKVIPPTPRNRKLRSGPRESLRTPDMDQWFNKLVQEVKDRAEFLEDMRALGQERKYRPIIEQEIASKIRQMEIIDKKQCDELDQLLGRESGKPPDRDSKLDLPVLSSRAQHDERVSQLRHLVVNVLHTQEFASVWVSTDDDEIATVAQRSGASVHRRSAETATDTAPSIVGVQEFCVNHPEVVVVALIQCTSPFLRPSFLDTAFSMMSGGDHDSVFSITREFKLRWKELSGGGVEPLNFDPSRRPRRQDWPGELVENGMFYFTTCRLAQQGLLQGERCGVVEIPKNYSIEIDTPLDLELARVQLESHLFSGTAVDNSWSVPPYYREVYDICAPTGSSVSKEFFTKLLVKSGLPSQTLSLIWELVDAKQGGALPRSSLYKALALVALAQQGRQPSAKLLDNFSGEELPCPELGDLSDLKQLTHRDSNPTRLGLRYPDLYQLDSINLDVVPEKKGLFLKHIEYQVSSKLWACPLPRVISTSHLKLNRLCCFQRFGALVRRRYNDFVALHELLLGRFPYRLIPKLPPKRVVGGE